MVNGKIAINQAPIRLVVGTDVTFTSGKQVLGVKVTEVTNNEFSGEVTTVGDGDSGFVLDWYAAQHAGMKVIVTGHLEDKCLSYSAK